MGQTSSPGSDRAECSVGFSNKKGPTKEKALYSQSRGWESWGGERVEGARSEEAPHLVLTQAGAEGPGGDSLGCGMLPNGLPGAQGLGGDMY